MRTTKLTTLTVAALLASTFASADTISLDVTVRDFNGAHSDFEGCIDGVVTGLVMVSLGADDNPVKSATTTCSIASAASFNQWYNDVAGVNAQVPITSLVLDNTITADPDVFTFASNAFFPVDGLGFNEVGVNGHNFHFTLESHSSFTYQGGETFMFTGDDDLWVFINDLLVVDIGGVHPAASSGVSLDTLGLTLGQTYGFDLFFAERHQSESNFRIDTSIELVSVPEPSTLALLGLGLLGMGLVGRRKA